MLIYFSGEVYLDVIQDTELKNILTIYKVITEGGNANVAVQLEDEPSSTTAFQFTYEPTDAHAEAGLNI